MVSYRFIGSGTTDEHGIAHITKDAEGQTLEHPGYTGTGAGLIEFVASLDSTIVSGSLVSEPYTVMDYIGYSASGSETYTTAYGVTQIFDLNGVTGDFEISATLKGSTSENAFGIAFNTHNGTQNQNLIRVGFGTNAQAIVTKVNNVQKDTWHNQTTYVADTDILMKIRFENGTVTCSVGNLSHELIDVPTGLRYVMLESWNFARTISYTDFKVERL